MLLRHFVTFCLLAVLAGTTYAAEDDNPVVTRALNQARQGHEDDAIATLQAELKSSPKNHAAWLLLGDILDYVGKPDDAAALWETGIKNGADAYELSLRLAKLHARQADDGPTVHYSRGMVEYKPEADKEQTAKFKAEHRARAIAALLVAMSVRRNNTDAALALAAQYTAAGAHDKALEVWDSLNESDLNNAEFILGRAQTQWDLGKKDEAAKGFALALKLNSHLVSAHQALSAYAKAAGRSDEAAEHDHQARFYDWLPPFASLAYSKENFATFEALNPERNATTGKVAADAGQLRAEMIQKLIKDETPTSSEFLAALCYHHEDCGAGEERMFEALGKRGKPVEALLLELIEKPQSTCTVRLGALTLARMKSEQLFPILVRYLPGDTRAVFFMDIAAALDELGDPRAVPELIKLIEPEKETLDSDGEDVHMFSRQAARERAVLALGAFKTEESTAALKLCAKNPALEIRALAALYRQTHEQSYAQQLTAKVATLRAYDAYLLGKYFGRTDTDAARELAKACEEREAKLNAEREKAGQKDK